MSTKDLLRSVNQHVCDTCIMSWTPEQREQVHEWALKYKAGDAEHRDRPDILPRPLFIEYEADGRTKFEVNYSCDRRFRFRALLDFLKLSDWTLTASSDGVIASRADNIVCEHDILFFRNGSCHTWAMLHHDKLGCLLVACTPRHFLDDEEIEVCFSKTGFTGVSVLENPRPAHDTGVYFHVDISVPRQLNITASEKIVRFFSSRV